MVRANTETDVRLTVAQIAIVSVLLTYAWVGIQNVQNVHQTTMCSPTSCFYCNCFIGLATAWIWEKQHIFQRNVCPECSRSMHADLMYSFHPFAWIAVKCFILKRSKQLQEDLSICNSKAAQMPVWSRENICIECSVSPSWLLDCGRMNGELGMNKWVELNMLYLHSVKLFNWKMVD